MNNSMTLSRMTVKAQTLAIVAAILASVALPQIFHAVGAVSGLGPALGQTFLPMHIPVLLVGLLAGPVAGLLAGAISPLISFAISGMPAVLMLPFITLELAGYGFVAGMLCRTKLPVFAKLILAQIAGRAFRAAAVLIAVFAFGSQTISFSSILDMVIAGLPGILLQWSMIPLLIFWVDNRSNNNA